MRKVRRFGVMLAVAAGAVVGPAAAVGATHTGCEHTRTTQAHASVPHHDNRGTHTAHASIPYCPPDDAPRRG